ncbi:hypothetical protein CLU79DRAFT_834877 [Phycomyces nitens]|nr:hypothetical protein CLU79DRAFT_834877 [Phycomyces nitens]
MSFNSFDVSPLTPCNDVQDILYDGLAMADFDLCHIQRGPSVPSHHDTIMYYLTDEELNYHLSVISLFPDSPYLPSLDYSSPSSSQDSYEEGARSESRPEQVKSGSTELIIKHYNPNGLPVVLNEDLEPIHLWNIHVWCALKGSVQDITILDTWKHTLIIE